MADDSVAENEVWINPYAECPICHSKRIDQISSEACCTVEYYHCADCGVWYDENGNIDDGSEQDFD